MGAYPLILLRLVCLDSELVSREELIEVTE